MHKQLIVMISTLAFAYPIISAASLFSSGTSQSSTGQSPTGIAALPPGTLTPMSPSTFNSQVTEQNAANHAAFQQNLTQKLTQLPPPQLSNMPSSSQGQAPQPAPTTSNSKTGTNTATESATENPPSTEEDATPTTPAATSLTTKPSTSANPPSAPTASQSQGYTGFSGGGHTTGQSSNQPKNSAGWSITY